MSLRIKNSTELEALKKRGGMSGAVENQIRKALSQTVATQRAERSVGEELRAINTTEPHLDFTARKGSISAEREKRKSRAIFYTLPEFDKSPDPAVVLYRACVRRWGRFYEGGEVVWELTIANPRAFSFDMALPKYRIAIEFDGFQYHSSKQSIQRDHIKTEQASRIGWIIFRIGKSRVINPVELAGFLSSIEQVMKSVAIGKADVSLFTGTSKKISYRSFLKSWEPTLLQRPPTFFSTQPGSRKKAGILLCRN